MYIYIYIKIKIYKTLKYNYSYVNSINNLYKFYQIEYYMSRYAM